MGGQSGLPFPQKLKMGKQKQEKETLNYDSQYEHYSTRTTNCVLPIQRPEAGAPCRARAARGACCALAARRVGNPSASHAVSGGDLWASVEDRLATRGIILGQVRAQSRLNLLRLATRRGCSRGQNRACIALRDVLVLHIICACAPHRKRRAHSRQAPPV